VITADQLLVHALGDYILQSDWMANNKTKHWWPALAHAAIYSLPFILFQPSAAAWLVIFGTHFLIDRYRLARYVVWTKNWLGPNQPWKDCAATGYPADRPAWLAVWLLIIADNVLHVAINGAALSWL
jgi:Protein of unknown function (DUF3307)